MRRVVKEKVRKINFILQQTGNPDEPADDKRDLPVLEELTPLQERISDILGPIVANGHAHSKESVLGSKTVVPVRPFL